MTLTKTPICNFGEKAKDFNLLSTENKKVSLDDIRGENGTLVMFICNHCPYVKAVIKDIVQDVKFLESIGVKSAAIMSNDVKNYPEDSYANMISFTKLHNFSFPYLFDETQSVAKAYKASCTPEFLFMILILNWFTEVNMIHLDLRMKFPFLDMIWERLWILSWKIKL